MLATPGRSVELLGPALRAAMVSTADGWLAGLLGAEPGLALVAVGGYGRCEPAPGSDLDLILLHDGHRRDVSSAADRVWYPVWDAGIPLDHSVRTVDEAVAVADHDLKVALGLLDARHVAGDRRLSATLVAAARARWRQRAPRRLPELRAAVADRARAFGEVAFLLEPDLKEARGGLRDVHALRALAAAQRLDAPSARILAAHEVLLDVRGCLPVRGRRRDDRLLLQEQVGVAAALDYADADALQQAVASAGRLVAYAWDVGWRQVAGSLVSRAGRSGGRHPPRQPLGNGVVGQDGEIVLAADAAPRADPVLVLRAAMAAARERLPLAPYALGRLVREGAPMPTPWPDEARDSFVSLLATGPGAVPVFEALDQAGLLVRLLPDWDRVRSRPQRNPYHRFTVDRHLTETAAAAAALTRRVRRPDLLLLAAFLHDIGKGWPGDHAANGAQTVLRIGPAMGLPPADTAVLETLVRLHLTLPEVATRRDLDDPATAARVARAVGSSPVLHLLHALTEADAQATGPAAWGPWKAALVADLVARTEEVLLAGAPRPRAPQLSAGRREWLASVPPGDTVVVLADDPRGYAAGASGVLVAAPDCPGLLAAVAGVFALHRLDVRRAVARSEDARALVELTVASRRAESPDPIRLRADLLLELGGRLHAADRLAERQRAYPPPAVPGAAPEVVFDAAAGDTIVEVRAPDGAGVLHRIVAELTRLRLDIRLALVATLGLDVVDTFYVRDHSGETLADGVKAQVRRDVLAALRPEPAVRMADPVG